MTKEEFMKLIDTLEFEELKNATITYTKKKPNSYTYGDNDTIPRTICINGDLEERINEVTSYQNDRIGKLFDKVEDLSRKIEDKKC